MKATLRASKTDPDMIELITKDNGSKKSTYLWAVIHSDFIYGETSIKELMEKCGEVTITIDWIA